MNILILTSSSYLAGSELAMIETMEVLKAHGHRVYLILPSDTGTQLPRVHSLVDGWAVVAFKWWMVTGKRRPLQAFKILLRNVVAVREIEQRIQHWHIDAVITSTVVNPAGAFAAQLAGVPHYWYLHELGKEDQNLEFVFPSRLCYSLMNRLTRGFIANSEITYQKFSNIFPAQKVKKVYYVVKTEAKAFRQRSFQADPLKLLMLSRIFPVKRQEDAIEALRLLGADARHFSLNLVGLPNPDYKRKLEDLVEKYGLQQQVTVGGFSNQVGQVLNDHDILILGSSLEAFGRVTVEAMKHGLIVLAANTGGSLELIEPGRTGFLFEVHNPTHLAQQLQHLLAQRQALPAVAGQAQVFASQLCNAQRHYTDLMQVISPQQP